MNQANPGDEILYAESRNDGSADSKEFTGPVEKVGTISHDSEIDEAFLQPEESPVN